VLSLDCVPDSGACTRHLSGLAVLAQLRELRLPSVSFDAQLWALASRLPLRQVLQLDVLDLAGGALAAVPALLELKVDEIWLPDLGREEGAAGEAGQAGQPQQGGQRRGLLAQVAPALRSLSVHYYSDTALLGDLWRHQHLSALSMSMPNHADAPADLAPLASLPRLAALALDDTHGGGALPGSLAPLAACAELRELTLCLQNLPPGQLAALAGAAPSAPLAESSAAAPATAAAPPAPALRRLALRVDSPLEAAALEELVALLLVRPGLEAVELELCQAPEGGAPLDEALRAEEGSGRLAGLCCEEDGRGLQLVLTRLDGSALRVAYIATHKPYIA
jgi:hypothetical protein